MQDGCSLPATAIVPKEKKPTARAPRTPRTHPEHTQDTPRGPVSVNRGATAEKGSSGHCSQSHAFQNTHYCQCLSARTNTLDRFAYPVIPGTARPPLMKTRIPTPATQDAPRTASRRLGETSRPTTNGQPLQLTQGEVGCRGHTDATAAPNTTPPRSSGPCPPTPLHVLKCAVL